MSLHQDNNVPYSILDISGDIGLSARGNDCREVFEHIGTGLYGLMTDIRRVNERHERHFRVEADSPESLLVRYLNELIFLFESEGIVGRTVRVDHFSGCSSGGRPYTIAGTILGEPFSPGQHEQRLLVKAATYHKLRLEEHNGSWSAEVIFDI